MDILMTLGDGEFQFRFAVETAACQRLERRSQWRWPVQERFWTGPARQFTGSGDDEIMLEGVVLPAFRGGLGQIKELRRLADKPLGEGAGARPLLLVTGYGDVLGEWIILGIEEDQPLIGPSGAPLEQHFRLRLGRFCRDVA